jgi:hypothetical protein
MNHELFLLNLFFVYISFFPKTLNSCIGIFCVNFGSQLKTLELKKIDQIKTNNKFYEKNQEFIVLVLVVGIM